MSNIDNLWGEGLVWRVEPGRNLKGGRQEKRGLDAGLLRGLEPGENDYSIHHK